MILLSSAYIFQHLFFFFQKIPSGTWSECQTVWIQIKTDILLVLIWVQTVCKGVIRPQKSSPARKLLIKKLNRFRAHYQINLLAFADQWLKWPYHQALIQLWPLKVTMLCYCLPSIHPIPWLEVEAGVMRKETNMLILVGNKITPCG